MKILSGPQGDALLTNAEVLEWIKEKKFTIQRRDVPEGVIKTPSATAFLARNLQQYLENSPSGAQTSKSARLLFEKLAKFNLSAPELMMIANISPEAYAHLTALIPDVYSRFDEDQIYEILEIVNTTLEKRVKRKQPEESQVNLANHNNVSQTEQPQAEQPQADTSHSLAPEESREAPETEAVSAQITDMTTAVQSVQVGPQQDNATHGATDETFANGIDATITDYSAYADMSTPDAGRENKSNRRATR